ncbi:MAG: TRAM domain-containing protein [Marinilabiliales bacterium]|nr:TRAM domain-containing protein [Marinilabiliales bacterium]
MNGLDHSAPELFLQSWQDSSFSRHTGRRGWEGRSSCLTLRGVTITDIGSEGNAIARVDDMVSVCAGNDPGDVVDVRVTKKKRRYMEGVALAVTTPSPQRITPPCSHFGVCGGCRWQHLPYDKQLFYKAQQVRDNLTRIGHTPIPAIDPITGVGKDLRLPQQARVHLLGEAVDDRRGAGVMDS